MTDSVSFFEQTVKDQIQLLNSGQILEALDLYFHEQGKMYENDNLFGIGRIECRKKQEPFINSAREITGKITGLKILEQQQICLFRNQSSFIDPNGKKFQIDGIHWQQWQDGKIIEERYFHKEKMAELISMGILENPGKLKPIKKNSN